MNNAKQIISGVILLSLGFCLGFFLNSKLGKKPEIERNSALEINQKTSSELEAKYKDLIELTDSPDKCEKAQKMLGEAMLLFITDIGLRAQILAQSQSLSTSSTQSLQQEPIDNEVKSETTPSKETEAGLPQTSSVATNLPPVEEMQTLPEGLSDPQLQNFLNQKISKDFRPKILNLRPLPGGVIQRMNGLFQGEVIFFDSKKTSLQISLRVQLDPGSTNQGEFNLTISGESTNSESNGRGEFGNLFSDPDEVTSVIVSGCGGDCYLQLFSVKRNQKHFLLGNFYQKDSKSLKFLPTGRVSLK